MARAWGVARRKEGGAGEQQRDARTRADLSVFTVTTLLSL